MADSGWGNSHFTLNKKITNYGILKQMSEKIKESVKYKEVVITNYILMK